MLKLTQEERDIMRELRTKYPHEVKEATNMYQCGMSVPTIKRLLQNEENKSEIDFLVEFVAMLA